MKKIAYLFFLVATISCEKNTENEIVSKFEGEIVSSKTFGGSNDEKINSVVATIDGGCIVVGYSNSFDGDVTKNHDLIDIWVTRYDSDFNLLWSKTFGGSLNDYGMSIIATTDGNFTLAGYSASNNGDIPGNVGLHDFIITKINANGDILWTKNYGFTSHDHAHKIIQTRDGGYFVTGFAEYEGILGSGGTDNNGAGHEIGHRNARHGSGEFLGIKLASNGDFQWFRYFGGTQNDRVNDVVQANDGGFVMAGYSESTNFDVTDNKGSYDYWIIKIHEDGALHWKHNYGGTGIDQAFGITKTGNNSYLIAGKSNSSDIDVSKSLGSFDAWIIHIDDMGHLIWNKSFGGSEFESATTIKKLSNGNFGVVGSSRSTFSEKANNGQNDYWMFEIDINPNTTLIWQKTFGGSKIDIAIDFFENTAKEVVVVGESQSNDKDVPQNKGSNDLWMMKLK